MNTNMLRKVIDHRVEINASAEQIWPLLCPVREYDWIEGWKADLLYSESGVNELDCMFKTKTIEGKTIHWMTSRFEPETFHLEFIRFHDEGFMSRYRLKLVPKGENKTHLELFMVMTSVSEESQAHFPHEYLEKMEYWSRYMGAALEHYIHSGEILEERLFPIN